MIENGNFRFVDKKMTDIRILIRKIFPFIFFSESPRNILMQIPSTLFAMFGEAFK